MEQIAKTLKVPVEAIKNFDEDAPVNIISNTFTDFKDNASGINTNCNLTFNPIDKWLEAMDEIKRLNAALVKEKDEKIALLEKMLGEKKK